MKLVGAPVAGPPRKKEGRDEGIAAVVSVVCSSLLIPGLWVQPAWGQEGERLSAREIFYSAPKVAAKRPQKSSAPRDPET